MLDNTAPEHVLDHGINDDAVATLSLTMLVAVAFIAPGCQEIRYRTNSHNGYILEKGSARKITAWAIEHAGEAETRHTFQASVNFVVRSYGQEQDSLRSFILNKIENDPEIVSRTA